MSEPKNEQKPEEPKSEEHEGEHADEKHPHGHHGHGHFHPEKYRREHAVIHPSSTTVKHIDPGAVEI